MDELTFEIEADEFEITLPICDQYGSLYQSPRHAERTLDLSCSAIKAQLARLIPSVAGFRFDFAGSR